MGWEQGWALRMGLGQLGLLYKGDWVYFCSVRGSDDRFYTLLRCVGVKVAALSDPRVSRNNLRAVWPGLKRVK